MAVAPRYQQMLEFANPLTRLLGVDVSIPYTERAQTAVMGSNSQSRLNTLLRELMRGGGGAAPVSRPAAP